MSFHSRSVFPIRHWSSGQRNPAPQPKKNPASSPPGSRPPAPKHVS